MIQRIQTVYLLVAGFLFLILTGSIIFIPVGPGDITFNFTPKGLLNSENASVMETIPLLILYIVITVLTFGSIFLYKHRTLQMRISVFGLTLMLMSYVLLFFYKYQIDQAFEIAKTIYRLPVLIPLVSAILLILAFRNIRKDELLIKSLNRLR